MKKLCFLHHFAAAESPLRKQCLSMIFMALGMKRSVFCLLVFSTLSVFSAFAQDMGRLPDGRAYRLDSEGNRVVDYIADLEINVDGLNRQVTGLEDELQQKMVLIQDLQLGGGCKQELHERDLIAKKVEAPKADCSQEISVTRSELSSQFELRKQELENQRMREIASLNERLASVQAETSRLSSHNQQLEAKLSSVQTDAEDIKPLLLANRNDAETARQELEKEKVARSNLAAQLGQVQEELSATKASLSARDDAYELLNTRFAAAQKKMESISEARASLDLSVANPTSANESTAANENEKPEARAATQVAARSDNANVSLSSTRDRAMESLKESVTGDMNRVQGLIASRDKLVKEYKDAKKARVDFMPAAALSSSNESISDLRSRLDSVNSMRQLSEITGSVRQIEQRMQSDIALISRLKRIQ